MTLEFSPDQSRAFDRLRRWCHRPDSSLLTFGGYAGTGKTTLIAEVARSLGSRNIHFLAPTGRAASVLGRKLQAAGLGHFPCTTIHSFAASPVEDPETGEVKGWRGRRASEELELVVVDEASMVGEELFEMIRAATDAPILAVGDHAQLPPIMSTLNLMAHPEVRLEQIHRQAADSPIVRLASHVRQGGHIEPEHSDGQAVTIRPKAEWREVLRESYPEGQRPHEQLDAVVLCQTNRVRCDMNEAVRLHQGRGYDPENGELVVCLKNMKLHGIYNGFRGVLHEPRTAAGIVEGRVSFPAERRLLRMARLCRFQFGRPKTLRSFLEVVPTVASWEGAGSLFDWGYALTAHKAQGSEWPYVVLCHENQPWGMSRDTYQRWLYTAVTRASERLVVLR